MASLSSWQRWTTSFTVWVFDPQRGGLNTCVTHIIEGTVSSSIQSLLMDLLFHNAMKDTLSTTFVQIALSVVTLSGKLSCKSSHIYLLTSFPCIAPVSAMTLTSSLSFSSLRLPHSFSPSPDWDLPASHRIITQALSRDCRSNRSKLQTSYFETKETYLGLLQLTCISSVWAFHSLVSFK